MKPDDIKSLRFLAGDTSGKFTEAEKALFLRVADRLETTEIALRKIRELGQGAYDALSPDDSKG